MTKTNFFISNTLTTWLINYVQWALACPYSVYCQVCSKYSPCLSNYSFNLQQLPCGVPLYIFFFRHCKIKEIVVPFVYFTKTWSKSITRIFISVYIIAFSYSFTSVQLTCQAFADGLSHENHLLPINFFLSFSTLPFDLALLRTSEKKFFLSRYRTSKCLETNHNLVTSSWLLRMVTPTSWKEG